jgi:hypothetical protein
VLGSLEVEAVAVRMRRQLRELNERIKKELIDTDRRLADIQRTARATAARLEGVRDAA